MTKFCIIESPFAPKATKAERAAVELARNRAYVAACMADSFRRGEVPFASHAIYTLKGVLDDRKPEERTKGILAGFQLAQALQELSTVCSMYRVVRAIYRDRDWSNGMVEGLKHGTKHGMTVEDRYLGAQWSREQDELWMLDERGQLVLAAEVVRVNSNLINTGAGKAA